MVNGGKQARRGACARSRRPHPTRPALTSCAAQAVDIPALTIGMAAADFSTPAPTTVGLWTCRQRAMIGVTRRPSGPWACHPSEETRRCPCLRHHKAGAAIPTPTPWLAGRLAMHRRRRPVAWVVPHRAGEMITRKPSDLPGFLFHTKHRWAQDVEGGVIERRVVVMFSYPLAICTVMPSGSGK